MSSDCCDGSDEYLSGNCTDVCYALGEEARQQAKEQAELLRQGSELRQQLIAKGKQIKQEKIVIIICFIYRGNLDDLKGGQTTAGSGGKSLKNMGL